MNTDFRSLTAYEIDFVAGGYCPAASSGTSVSTTVVNQGSNIAINHQTAAAGNGTLLSVIPIAANIGQVAVVQTDVNLLTSFTG